MKILYVGTDSQICGASYSMAKLVEELEIKGVEVISVVHQGNTEKILKNQKKRYYIVNAWSWIVGRDYSRAKRFIYMVIKKILNIPCYFKYLKIIKEENPDIVHINALTTYVIASAAVKLNKPIVWHIRELIEEDLNGQFWNKNEAYKLMKKADYFVAISQCVKKKYQSIVGGDKIRCIYNGVDKKIFFNKNHEILNNRQIVITMAGRITKEKGQFLCLQSLLPLMQENDNVVLQYAGIGSETEINKIKELRLASGLSEERVKFLGFVKDMNCLWSETDIAVIYSQYEAFGRVTVEAKMAGALVVGYDSGGTSELIEDGIDGYLFNNDSCTLYDVVKNVLNKLPESKSIASFGRKKAADIFTSENNAKQICELYHEIVSK